MWAKTKAYLWRLAVACDQLLNTVAGGFPDETFSARAWQRGHIDQVAAWLPVVSLVDLVFFWDANHCATSYESEAARRHYSAAMRRSL